LRTPPGVCIALINWHKLEGQPVRSIASRGQVVKVLAAKSSTEEIPAGLAASVSLDRNHSLRENSDRMALESGAALNSQARMEIAPLVFIGLR